jgi:hypothetical protein
MEMEQMMACLLAEIRTNNEEFEVLCGTLVSKLDILQAMTEVIQEEIIAKRDTHQEMMEDSMNAWQREMKACQEAMEACLKKKRQRPNQRR